MRMSVSHRRSRTDSGLQGPINKIRILERSQVIFLNKSSKRIWKILRFLRFFEFLIKYLLGFFLSSLQKFSRGLFECVGSYPKPHHHMYETCEIIKQRHAKDMFHLKIALSTKEYMKRTHEMSLPTSFSTSCEFIISDTGSMSLVN